MKKRHGFGLMVVMGTAIAILVLHERARQDRALSKLRGEVTALADESSRDLTARAVPLAMNYLAHAASGAANVRPPQVDEGASAPAARSPEAAPALQAAELHHRLETAFAKEHLDPAWTTRAKQIADEKLPALLPPGSVIRSLECRAAFCRLETAHKDFEAYWTFVKKAFLSESPALWNAMTYSMPLNDDPSEGLMVTYIAREGQGLPAVVN